MRGSSTVLLSPEGKTRRKQRRRRQRKGKLGPVFGFYDPTRWREVDRSRKQSRTPMGGRSEHSSGTRGAAAPESRAVWRNRRRSTWACPWGSAGCTWSRPRC